MSGHSKWHSIKHKKAAADAKRGKLFTKLIKELTVAARLGGGDPDANPRLRLAIEKAKAANMPSDNIKRAIQKGTGELPGVTYEEVVYEGYGPGGVAVMLEVMTDNKNRTVAEIRHIFSKYGGNMGASGCVSWIFEKKGMITVSDPAVDEDTLMEVALDAGAVDMEEDGGLFLITTTPEGLGAVREAIEAAGIPVENAEVTLVPQSTVALEAKQAERMLKLMERLEDHDDVQNVYANFDIADDILQQMT
jgi:YebC/PmpR family DNA-binding regulatory protein